MLPMRPEFKTIFETASKLGVNAVIAGGAVVDFDRASDIDVFVLQQPWTLERRKSLADDCDALLIALGGTVPAQDAETYIGNDDRGSFYRAGKVPNVVDARNARLMPIHVTGWRPENGPTTVVRLLETFDLSIHAWAINEVGRLIGCDDSTRITQPIRILHMTPTTPERLVKLTERYFPPITHTYGGLRRSAEPTFRSSHV